MHNRSPAAFAATLRDYADALTKVGDHDKAREVAARTVAVERVIGKAQVDRAAAAYQRYPAGCRS